LKRCLKMLQMKQTRSRLRASWQNGSYKKHNTTQYMQNKTQRTLNMIILHCWIFFFYKNDFSNVEVQPLYGQLCFGYHNSLLLSWTSCDNPSCYLRILQQSVTVFIWKEWKHMSVCQNNVWHMKLKQNGPC